MALQRVKFSHPYHVSSYITCEAGVGGTIASAQPHTPCQHAEPFLLASCLLIEIQW